VTCGLFFILATLAILMTRLSNGFALLWVANAFLFTVLYKTPRKQWAEPLLGAFLASILVTALFGAGAAPATMLGVANLLETLLAVEIFKRLDGGEDPFGSLPSILLFTVGSALIAPAVSAVIAVLTVSAHFKMGFWSLWTDWLLGHGLGAIIATPIFFQLFPEGRVGAVRRSRISHYLARSPALLLVAGSTVLVFSQHELPLLFFPILPVLVATFLLGRSGAAASVALVAILGGALTIKGSGPIILIHGSQAFRFQFFQFYIANLFLIALPISAILAQRAKLSAALEEKAAALSLLTDNNTDILLSLDIDGTIRVVTEAIRTFGGYDPKELVGHKARELIHPDDVDEVAHVHRLAVDNPGEAFTVEYRALRLMGDPGWFETRTRAVLDAAGNVTSVVSAVRDVGHRKRLEARLAEVARTDTLTGLLNRRGFFERLTELKQTSGAAYTACIAIIDVDYFKNVNDRFGHVAGDEVLCSVAEACRKGLRADDVLGRIGGEEFAIVLSGSSIEDGAAVCERLRRDIEKLVMLVDGQRIRVTASFGLAVFTARDSAEDSLKIADQALYEAKESGRNRICLAA
jgi:diguanylate cyclase (GGDEF)-like protein/PAS domain S-box-containing protein